MICRHAPYCITRSFQSLFFYSVLYNFFFCINAEREFMNKRMPKDLNKGFTVWGEPGKAKVANRGSTLC